MGDQQPFFWQAVIADRDQQAMYYPHALVDQWVTLTSFPEEHKEQNKLKWTLTESHAKHTQKVISKLSWENKCERSQMETESRVTATSHNSVRTMKAV